MRLERIGTDSQEQEQKAGEREAREVGHLRKDVRQEKDGTADKELFGLLHEFLAILLDGRIGDWGSQVGAPGLFERFFNDAGGLSEEALCPKLRHEGLAVLLGGFGIDRLAIASFRVIDMRLGLRGGADKTALAGV